MRLPITPFLLFALALTTALPAQVTTIYRNKFNQRVDSTADYEYFDQLTALDSGMTQVKSYAIIGGLLEQGNWLHYNADSIQKSTRVGVHEHFLSGKIWYTEHYQNGKKHGYLRSYYADGPLKRIERYRDGILLGGQSFQPDGTEMPFTPLEKAPSFPGGETELMNYLSSNIRYPKAARKKNIQGWVALTFVVNRDGAISNVKLIKTIGGGCDEEAVRVIKEMPRWEPGLMDDKPVKVRFTLPIRFRLE